MKININSSEVEITGDISSITINGEKMCGGDSSAEQNSVDQHFIENDKISLLSIAGFYKYRDNIPKIEGFWWLGFGISKIGVDERMFLGYHHSDHYNIYIDNNNRAYILNPFSVNASICAIRPVIRLSEEDKKKYAIGDVVFRYRWRWVHIGDGLAIAQYPVDYRRYDKESNDYRSSEIRKWLNEEWIKGREYNHTNDY